MQLPAQWSNNALTYQGLAYIGASLICIDMHDTHSIARKLLCIVCGFDRIYLITHANAQVPQKQKQAYYQALMRFNKYEPLSRIEGVGHFYGFDFQISSDTLDPRPETEILIDLLRKTYPDHKQALKILDIGTGSGCLAITAARFYSNACITGLDICEKALIIAQRNAINANVESRCNFSLCDSLLTNIAFEVYDVILCNPPYIPQKAREYLDSSVINYDPEIALFYGNDGLGFYNLLAEASSEYLKKNSSIFLEFGIGQAKCIKTIFADKALRNFYAVKDDNQIIRAAHIKF